MHLKTRFLLVACGVVIFLIVTPMLVLFARGFKLDLKNRQLIKTGSLVVASQPSRAAIFIDEEKTSKRTPATVRFLLPGDYVVRVEKTDYQSWTKRLSVRAQFVTWANFNRDFITLFYKQAKLVERIKINDYSLSSDRSKLALLQANQLFAVNTHNFELKKIGEIKFPQLLAKISWDDPERLLFVLNGLVPDLLNIDFPAISKVEVNDQFISVFAANQLFVFDNDWQLAWSGQNIKNSALIGNVLWLADGEGIKTVNLRTKAVELKIALVTATHLNFLPTPDKIFLIIDSSLYNLNNGLEKIYDSVTDGYWDEVGKQLVFYSKNEILLYNVEELVTTLVHRSISPISSPIHNSYTGYMFFADEGKLKAIEIDGRDHRNIYNITDASDNFTLSRDGKFAYVAGGGEIKVLKIR